MASVSSTIVALIASCIFLQLLEESTAAVVPHFENICQVVTEWRVMVEAETPSGELVTLHPNQRFYLSYCKVSEMDPSKPATCAFIDPNRFNASCHTGFTIQPALAFSKTTGQPAFMDVRMPAGCFCLVERYFVDKSAIKAYDDDDEIGILQSKPMMYDQSASSSSSTATTLDDYNDQMIILSSTDHHQPTSSSSSSTSHPPHHKLTHPSSSSSSSSSSYSASSPKQTDSSNGLHLKSTERRKEKPPDGLKSRSATANADVHHLDLSKLFPRRS